MLSARCRAWQRGLSLIEALVSLALLAIALYGMLGMQLGTLVDARASTHQSQAVRLADDFAERIKAHPDAPASLPAYATGWDAAIAPPDCRRSAGCDAAALAQWDIARWKQAVADALPGGQGAAFEAPGGGRLTVLVAWRATAPADPRAASNPKGSASVQLPTDARCPPGLVCRVTHVQP
ncbi:type IV pilus modification protein PilV [Variovorax sp. J22P168]|uniref:type IV pilus modification protein PilV n=1 Tax=Variovorax jilinensis TaxID=3053513 RepID=UPI0025759535|nr:type IV pilus modification protein PilV [Variovorax sp. J22P168]MDM0012062.1 type IV pilus modification protein PilV [Variovorax sp. J22P168]